MNWLKFILLYGFETAISQLWQKCERINCRANCLCFYVQNLFLTCRNWNFLIYCCEFRHLMNEKLIDLMTFPRPSSIVDGCEGEGGVGKGWRWGGTLGVATFCRRKLLLNYINNRRRRFSPKTKMIKRRYIIKSLNMRWKIFTSKCKLF